MSDLKSRIRKFRVDNEMTLFDMAKIIGVSSAKLSQFEYGKAGLDIDSVEKLIDIIGTPQSERLREALSDVIDGHHAFDLSGMTGLNHQECEKIIALAQTGGVKGEWEKS